MGQRVALWHVYSTVRTDGVLDRYGDSIDDIFLVAYELRDSGLVYMNIQNTVESYRAKWPNIRWWLTVQAFQSSSFRKLGNPNDPFTVQILAALDQIYDTYPWIYGLDIDAEGFQGAMTSSEVMASYRTLGDHARSRGLRVSAALPAATEGNYSVGGETWLDYQQFGAYFDHVAIMTYDFAWSGSAPGPIAPRFWVQQVYDWATKVIPRHKILMGVPAYGQNWAIHAPVEDLPGYPGWPYRGDSGAYYWFWFIGTGQWGPMSDDDQPEWRQTRASWMVYRDKETNSPFLLAGVYWWATGAHFSAQRGMTALEYNGKPYLVRYGRAAAEVVGQLADQRVTDQYAEHSVRPMQVVDSTGKWVNHDVHNLTLEVLQRDPQSATIMDDDCANTGSLDIYYTKTGQWSHWRQGDPMKDSRTPGQFRVSGAGRLSLTNINGGGDYHVQGRFQFPQSSGRAGVFCGSFEATVDPSGTLTLARNGTTLDTWSVAGPGSSSTPFSGRAVVGLRVRGNRARVYYGLAEDSMSLIGIYVDNSYTAGPSGMISTAGPVWFDHVRWGDGWWYNPREAVDVQIGSFRFDNVGRVPRTNVTWNEYNRFRPNTDVEEIETRTKSISPDWEFVHVKNVGIPAGVTKVVRIIPRDIEVWVGTAYLCDPNGTALCHYSDAEYMAHCRTLADQEWGLGGIAVWRLGQEDTRFWERIKGGRLDPGNRIQIL